MTPTINPILDEQERQLKILDLCVDVLKHTRNELYLNMRFLDLALSQFAFVPDNSVHGLATDGGAIYYVPDVLLNMYHSNPIAVNRAYMHMMMHCMFAHVWHAKGKEEPYWQIACDIAVEDILDSMYKRCLRIPPSPYRRVTISKFHDKYKVLTAERIYKVLLEERPNARELGRMLAEFNVDDHSIWERNQNRDRQEQMKDRWQDIREKMEVDMETFSKETAESSKSLLDHVRAENRKRYDYKDFLRKFSVLKEEMSVDMDSFDYVYYTYGLSMYGNMPLIEPLETKEVHKVEDFVIAVDTSMSCSGELIRKFLQETWNVLSEKESFFRKINVRIIQCDERVQSDVKITSPEEMGEYLDHFEVIGYGGTDFRPVFLYVDQLQQMGEFNKLKGLIYFTDGYGIFPARMPNYETAFVFLREDFTDVDVPPWAIKLILEEEDLENMAVESEDWTAEGTL